MADDWRDELAGWLQPFVAKLGDRRRVRMCPAYVEGLIGPGDRKSVQPMAMRSSGIGYDQLHHFIGGALWDSTPLEKELCRQADGLVGGNDAWLIIDDSRRPHAPTAVGSGEKLKADICQSSARLRLSWPTSSLIMIVSSTAKIAGAAREVSFSAQHWFTPLRLPEVGAASSQPHDAQCRSQDISHDPVRA